MQAATDPEHQTEMGLYKAQDKLQTYRKRCRLSFQINVLNNRLSQMVQ
jgi:hypothetical protein